MAANLSAPGQTPTATITGTITNSESGAIIAGAAVEVKDLETGVTYKTKSLDSGRYEVANLPLSTYALQVRMPWFKTYYHPNIKPSATQAFHEDVQLQPMDRGALSQPSTPPKTFSSGTPISLRSEPEYDSYEYTVWNGVDESYTGRSPILLHVRLSEKVRYAIDGVLLYVG